MKHNAAPLLRFKVLNQSIEVIECSPSMQAYFAHQEIPYHYSIPDSIISESELLSLIEENDNTDDDMLFHGNGIIVYVVSGENNEYELFIMPDILSRKEEYRLLQKEKDTFAYNIAHDLNAPMRSMRSYVGMLQEEMPDNAEELMALVERIRNNVDTITGHIAAAYRYSKVSSHVLKPENVNLETILKHGLIDLRSQIAESDADLDFSLDYTLKTDKYLLTIIFQEIIKNSLVYKVKEKKLRINIYYKEKHDRLEIFFQDNGIGIDEKKKKYVFGMFERLHGIESYPGSGAGLAIAKRCCDHLNATIDYTSLLGEKTIFIVSLPLHF